MAEFIATVSDQRLRSRLERALDGGKPFRRFKDVLAHDPGERERWFAFKDGRLSQRVRDWLEAKEIELLEDPDRSRENSPDVSAALPPTRVRLLALVLDFVR